MAMSATGDPDPVPELAAVIAPRLHRDPSLQRGLHGIERVELDSPRRMQLSHQRGELSGMTLVLLCHATDRPTSTAVQGEGPVVVDAGRPTACVRLYVLLGHGVRTSNAVE